MRIQSIILCWGLALTLLTGCFSDDDNVVTTFVPEPPLRTVEAEPLVRIIDIERGPIADAVVTSVDKEMVADANGVIKSDLGAWNSNGVGVIAEKEGYFTGRYATYFFAGATQWTEFSLFQKRNEKTAHTDQDALITFGQHLEVEIPTDGWETLDGEAYQGAYGVAMRPMEVEELMTWQWENLPDFEGIKQVYLLDAVSASGKALEVRDSIRVQIDGIAATDRIYVLSEREGFIEKRPQRADSESAEIFLEQVSVIAIGSEERSSLVSGKIVDQMNEPLAHAFVLCTNQRTGEMQRFITTADGDYMFRSSNDIYNLQLVGSCSSNPLMKEIDGASLGGVHRFELDADEVWRPQGRVIDCDKELYTAGYVLGKTDEQTWLYPIDAQGRYSGFHPRCLWNELTLSCYAYAEDVLLSKEDVSIVDPDVDLDLYACDQKISVGATIVVGNRSEIFSQCVGSVEEQSGVVQAIDFTIMNSSWDEFHRYTMESINGQVRWNTSSRFLQMAYEAKEFDQEFELNQFTFRGKDYVTFKGDGLIFRNVQTGLEERGSVEYTMQQ